MTGFGERLKASFDKTGHLCVGIDPHPFLLDVWECPDSAAGLREFSLRVIEACAGKVGIIKPQVAFFERHGAAGFTALETVINRAKDAEMLVISDCKRGDIGNTMEAYAQAWLTPDWSLASDAITVSPYLGIEALEQTADYAVAQNKGVFILAATSNPEALLSQSAVIQQGENAGKTVAAANLNTISNWSLSKPEKHSVGAVLGATLNLDALGINPSDYPEIPILAPGFGYQGARVEDSHTTFGPLAKYLIVSETRSVLGEGKDAAKDIISRRVDEVAAALG